MGEELPIIYIARHGETAWSLTGQYTGLTDLPLTEHGEEVARRLHARLQGLTFDKVYTSPLQRARREPANWPVSGRWPRLIPTWWSGITASSRAASAPK